MSARLAAVVSVGLSVLVAAGCSGVASGDSTSQQDYSISPAQNATGCPSGFVDALASSLRNVESASIVEPSGLGLGELGASIACAVQTRSTPDTGIDWDRDSFYTVVVMQAEVPESEVRDGLVGLGFENSGWKGWARDDAAPGEVQDTILMTFGGISRNLTGNSPQWSKYRDAFPPQTVVLGASVRRSGADSGPAPKAPRAAPRWSCSYSPTLNDDWHDDVFCTNGSKSRRPYLRPSDSFVTLSEIMESARKYERRLNGS
jgi:hypothetical protein